MVTYMLNNRGKRREVPRREIQKAKVPRVWKAYKAKEPDPGWRVRPKTFFLLLTHLYWAFFALPCAVEVGARWQPGGRILVDATDPVILEVFSRLMFWGGASVLVLLLRRNRVLLVRKGRKKGRRRGKKAAGEDHERRHGADADRGKMEAKMAKSRQAAQKKRLKDQKNKKVNDKADKSSPARRKLEVVLLWAVIAGVLPPVAFLLPVRRRTPPRA